jgi:hypothetical protein
VRQHAAQRAIGDAEFEDRPDLKGEVRAVVPGEVDQRGRQIYATDRQPHPVKKIRQMSRAATDVGDPPVVSEGTHEVGEDPDEGATERLGVGGVLDELGVALGHRVIVTSGRCKMSYIGHSRTVSEDADKPRRRQAVSRFTNLGATAATLSVQPHASDLRSPARDPPVRIGIDPLRFRSRRCWRV